jgi:hypothetical protein
MFAQIDHVGVAVDDLDAAIALHEQAYGLALAHRGGRVCPQQESSPPTASIEPARMGAWPSR